MEYPTSSMNSGQSAYTSHQQDNTRISPGCNPQPNPTSFPSGDTGPHTRGYGSYPPAYQTSNEFGGPAGHTASNPPTYSHVYPPESHGQSLTLNQLLQQGSTPNSYPVRPHGGPPMQASYCAYEHYPYGYKPGVPGGVGERPQGNTYPYAGAQGQRYSDPYGRPTYPNYPHGPSYTYYQSPPMAQQPPQRQQPASSQAHPMEFSNSSLPPRPAQPNIGATGAAGPHANDRPPSGTMNAHAHPSPSPVHSSQMSSPLHASALNTTQASGWSSHTPQPPFGSPHQLAHGQASQQQLQQQQQNRPRSASRDSQQKTAADSSVEPHGPQMDSDRGENQLPGATGLEDPVSRPQSRLSDSGRPSTANSTGSAGLRDHPSDEQSVPGSTVTSVPASSSATEVNLSGANLAPVDSSPSTAGSAYVTNPTLSPIPTTPRGTPPSHPYSVFSQSGGTPVSLQSGQAISSQANTGPNRPSSQPNQSPRPYGIPPQSSMGPRQPYPPYMHSLPPQQQPPQPHYMVGSPRPGFYSGMPVAAGGGVTVTGSGPGGAHPSMRPSMHPMGSVPGPVMGRSGPPGSFFSQGMMPPPAAPPPPQQQQQQQQQTPNSSQANLTTGAAGPAGVAQAGFMSGGPYPSQCGVTMGPSNNPPWESHPQTAATSLSSGVTSAMSQSHFGGGRPSPIYSGAVDRGMGYPGSPQSNAVSSGSSVTPHSSPHAQPPSMSMTPGGYSHPQPPPAYPTHGQHPQMPYPPTQLPYPSHGPAHSYPTGMTQSGGQPGVPATAYPTGMVSSGSGALAQPGREQPHSQYGNDVVPASERGAAPAFCSVPPSVVATAGDPSAFPTSVPGGGSPAGLIRSGPVSAIGSKLPPGAVLGKVTKMDTGIRSVTPNSAGPTMTNASPLANASSVSGVLDEPPPGISSLPPHQLSHSGTGATTAQQHQQQHQAQPHCAMPQSGQPGMQPFPGGPGGYWSEGGPPGQFAGSVPPGGMGPQGPHGFPPFQQHYRMPGSGIPPQQSMPQHLHGMPNSVGCPTPSAGPMYGAGVGPYGNAHAHPSGHSISTQSSSVFHRLLEMGTEPERRPWLEHYVRFMEEIGKPLVGLPQVVKQPLDLYRFYLAVRERGGVLEVIKARRWKEISQLVNINASASAAYTLRKNYCKFLLDYECRFDRCGADPTPLLAHIEAMSGKKKKPSSTEDGLANLSASGQGLSSSQAPPSPAGSHSSASSSLLPPGSGSASLSGVPSGTAGSAASDSQLGPSGSQSRFGDPCAQSANSAVGESPNGMLNSPGSSVTTSHGGGGGVPFSQSSVQSPQRPASSANLNGYSNAPHGSAESVARSNANWPWISESMASAPHQPPAASVNGFPTTMSPVRGPLSVHGMQLGFDAGSRPNATTPTPSPKSSQPRAPTPGPNVAPMPQPARSPVCSTVSTSTSGAVGLPSPGLNTQAAPTAKGPDPGMHHHHLTGQYPPGGQPCPPGVQQQPMSQQAQQSQQQPSAQSQHPQYIGQLPGSPMHPSMQHALPPGAPAPPPGSPMHPRMGGPGVRGPVPFSGSVTPAHALGAPGADSITLLRMHNIRPPTGPQMPAYPPNAMPQFHGQAASAAANVPAHLIHHHGQRPGYVATILKRIEHYPFPPGSIEATQVELSRRRRYRAKDIGTVAPFKLLMALRSGLTAEVSWALNCLNILLRDESGLDSFTGTSLNALITNLAELWRHSLGEIFDHDLFVRSLEVPTNLASFGRLSGRVPPLKGTDLDPSKSSEKMAFRRRSFLHSLSKKSSSIGPTVPNGLFNLERDLVALANTRGVSVASLRDGIRRILRKCGDPVGDFLPVRARNGLLLNSTPIIPVNSSATPLHPGSLADSGLTSSRTRKRGARQLSTGFGHLSSNSSLMHGLNATAASGANSYAINLASHTISSAMKSENVPPWITARVTTAANSLRSPEAYTNLRELALFVIDELFEFKPPPGTLTVQPTPEVDIDPSHVITVNGMPNPEVYVSASDYLRELIMHGGGDTTCHIMPPFGAAPYPSKHWRGETTSLGDYYGSRGEVLSVGKVSSTPPPPEVGEEKCNPRGDLMDYDAIESLDDEAHAPNKRARHASTSSLPCPVLSPQPIEEAPDDPEPKPLISQTAPDSTPISFHPEEEEEHASSQSDTKNRSDVNADDQDEAEFSQLVMDANGRCPLRAREELVHHGPACLWPDHLEADDNEARAVRCLCVSTVLRNLSFWHLAEIPLSSHKPTLALIGRIILLGHEHVGPNDTWQSMEQTGKLLERSQCAWRTPSWLEDMRENALVLLVNLAGYLDLIKFEESIVRPILEGLLHWIICPTAVAIDPFPGHRTLSPRRLALEALNRLCVHESNVDLLLSTPGSRESDLHLLFGRLANWLALPEDQVTRELALSTMHYLTGGGASFNTLSDSTTGKPRGSGLSSTATQSGLTSFIGTTLLSSAKPCPVAGLLAFIEAAEATTRRVIDQCGVQALQERPELMGTSLEMVRRAGALLDRLAADPTGRTRFTPTLELRLLDLVTSRVLDATVAHLLCGALHRLSQNPPVAEEPEPTVTPLVPPIPSLSVVSQLLKNATVFTPTKPETVTNADETPSGAVETTIDATQPASVDSPGDDHSVAPPTPSAVNSVNKDTEHKCAIDDKPDNATSIKDTVLPPIEPVNHVDESPCLVPVKKECSATERVENSELVVENKESSLPPVIDAAVESSSWNSNCVDS